MDSMTFGTLCPFCQIDNNRGILLEDSVCRAIFDAFPVSQGHVLVIPRRHVDDYFSLSTAEQQHLWAVVNQCKELLQERYHPDGFNVGINVGVVAGQSIPHVHIHLIPRYKGDTSAPKGGVRGVIPDKQSY